jgi:hypothetical protein
VARYFYTRAIRALLGDYQLGQVLEHQNYYFFWRQSGRQRTLQVFQTPKLHCCGARAFCCAHDFRLLGDGCSLEFGECRVTAGRADSSRRTGTRGISEINPSRIKRALIAVYNAIDCNFTLIKSRRCCTNSKK